MQADLDLFTPVDGVAGLICRGFTMRQIAALLTIRCRYQQKNAAPCPAKGAWHALDATRRRCTYRERQRWRKS